ncbi:hypothetical protein IJ579_04635 [bacterium]|nr:hypothetical protein [bacterium]
MSTVEKISMLRSRIFNSTRTENEVARNSNRTDSFAKSNFQKNILMEDVFQSSKNHNSDKISFTGKLNAGSKRIYSTLVGSISNFGSKIQEGIEAINAFGTRMKNSIVNTWHKISEYGSREIRFDGLKNVLTADISTLFGKSHEREVIKLAKLDPVTEVKPMLTEALAALEADMLKAA